MSFHLFLGLMFRLHAFGVTSFRIFRWVLAGSRRMCLSRGSACFICVARLLVQGVQIFGFLGY